MKEKNNPKSDLENGKIAVLSGLTASGKEAVVRELKSHGFDLIVTHASRPPREGEQEGVDYFFVPSNEKFNELVNDGIIIEVPEGGSHGGSLKGTSKAQLERVFKGENLIWRVTPDRAGTVEEFFIAKFGDEIGQRIIDRTIVIFIAVEKVETLRERYKRREGEKADMDEFEKRINQDLKYFKKYKDRFNIVNNDGNLETTVEQVLALIENKFHNEERI